MVGSSSSTRDDSVEIVRKSLGGGTALLEGGDGIVASNLAPVDGQICSCGTTLARSAKRTSTGHVEGRH